MKEYRIVRQNNNAKPYSLWTFDNFGTCYCRLLELISDIGNCVTKDYYVCNDFFENKFFASASIKLKIEVRDVGAWKTYEEEEMKSYNKKIIKIY